MSGAGPKRLSGGSGVAGGGALIDNMIGGAILKDTVPGTASSYKTLTEALTLDQGVTLPTSNTGVNGGPNQLSTADTVSGTASSYKTLTDAATFTLT